MESAQAIATSGCSRRSRSSGWRSRAEPVPSRTFRQAVRTSTGLDRPVHDDDLPSLHRFASHLEPDLDAVVAGLTLPWDPGVVERHVNRIKMLKRPMIGRASFALLLAAAIDGPRRGRRAHVTDAEARAAQHLIAIRAGRA